jgi:hypothetical protein
VANFKELIETGKALFALIRDFSIFGVLVALFSIPGCVNTQLSKAGIVKGNFLGFEWVQKKTEQSQAETKAIADRIQQLSKDNEALQSKIADLSQLSTSPAVSAAVAELKVDAAKSARALDDTDIRLTKSLVTQQAILQQTGVASVNREGWIYLGWINQEQSQWSNSGPKTVDSNWPLSVGSEVTIVDAVNLHGATNTNQRRDGAVLGAVRAGSKLNILELDTSKHMLRGGWAVWARVQARL